MPSRVMAELGSFKDTRLSTGIINSQKEVHKAAEELLKLINENEKDARK